MKKKEWNEGLDHLDPDLIEKYLEQKDRLRQNKAKKKIWLRLSAVAACLAILVGAVIVVPMLMDDGTISPILKDDGIIPSPDFLPITNVQTPSNAPQYYGSDNSLSKYSIAVDISAEGLSVTAKLIETLPDIYTFFDDWNQHEYRLLRMKTVKLLKGDEMTEEFYYLVPVKYMTDFSIFDKFVIGDMAQFTYEYSVMYNKTQNKAEQLTLVVFGYRVYGYDRMGENFMAFDSEGNFDERLWSVWEDETEHAQAPDTIKEAESIIRKETPLFDLYVHLLKDISGEAEDVLKHIKSFENGLFIPSFSTDKHALSPEVQFHAVRYINGFATNEKVSVWCKEWTDGDKDTYAFTKARFSKDDMNHLPDMPSAFESIKRGLDSGSVTPPHFNSQEKLRNTTSGVFGWYAKTDKGIVGIIRVTWSFNTEKYQTYLDDAYYIIEYGSDKVEPINRDDLLEKLGEYETTYIYTGEYNEYGKVRGRYPMY